MQPADDRLLADAALDRVDECRKRAVAGRVPEMVVQPLQVVDIDDHDR